jgi:hypothetical protein
MSGYVPNNRNERPIPPQEPYNGDFDHQAARPLEGGAPQVASCLIGLRFVWDNGECLGTNIPYTLSPAGGTAIEGYLDDQGDLIHLIQSQAYDAQLLTGSDVDTDIASARSELQSALDDILVAERAEAAKLQAIQDQRNIVPNYLHTRLAIGKGFFLGAWGLLKTVKEYSDLVNPFTAFSNALRSAWQAKSSTGESWLAAYNRQFSTEQHRELVEALGFDPASITREQLAEAYELANFIYEDAPSKAMLGRFAVDYAKAQNVEEVAEFGGAALFEIVLAALLIVFTGGAGLAARGAVSVSYLGKLTRLGNALKRLSAALKRARIRLGGRAQGNGTGAQTVELKRPSSVAPEPPQVPKPVAGALSGSRTKIPQKADAATRRSLIMENEAADVLVENGLDVAQNPKVAGTTRNPDLLILKGEIDGQTLNNEVADVFSPGQATSARNIRSTIDEKVNVKKQAETIVVNLNGSDRTASEIAAALKLEPVPNLKNVIVVQGRSTSLLPIGP